MVQILLIEKDESLRENCKELFKFLKHQVGTLESLDGINSISQITTRYFSGIDIVIADTDVVGLDGLKLKKLFNNDSYRIPIVFISADHIPEYSLEREELSAIAFLRKPFENSALLEYVSKAQRLITLLQKNSDTQKAIAKLLINQPPALPQEIALKRSYTLGRYRDNDEVHADIRLTSASASRKHAYLVRIYKGAESYYKLIDFSANGILINERRMGKMVRLNHQDEITFYPGCKAVYTEISREDNDLDATLTGPSE